MINISAIICSCPGESASYWPLTESEEPTLIAKSWGKLEKSGQSWGSPDLAPHIAQRLALDTTTPHEMPLRYVKD